MNRQLFLFLLLTLIFMSAGPANADYYAWEDENGVSHITDYPPPSYLKNRNMKIYDSGIGRVSGVKDKKSADPAKPAVALYTKNDCPDCDRAREFLKSKKLDFTEYNMDQDRTAAEKRKGMDDSTDVPFAVINRNNVYGFSESVYNRALKPSP